MLNPSYLSLSRHHIYYFRWPLPPQFRQQGKTAFIKLSLRTREPKEALQRANMLAYHAEGFIRQDCVQGMNYIEVKSLLETFFADLLAERKQQIDEDGPLTPARLHRLKKTMAYMQDDEAYESGEFFFEMLRQGNVVVIEDGETIEEGKRYPAAADQNLDGRDIGHVLRTLDIDLAAQSIGYKRLKDLYRPAAIAFYERLIEYSESQKQFNFDAPTLGQIATDTKAASRFARPEHRLGNIVKTFMAEMDKAQVWGIRTRVERKDCYDYLLELLGENFNIVAMDAAKARYIKEALMATPVNRRKIKATRDLSLIEQIKIEGVQTLSIRSVNKYLICFSSLCDWAVNHGYLDKNPFKGLALKEKGKQKRDWFPPEQIKAMLAELDKGKDGLADSDMKYWGALIGIYTGARLNEIASLTVHDVKRDADTGIWYFDINDDDEKKRLKTQAATRLVPVHSELLRRGFLEYIERVSKMQGDDLRLLYALTYTDKDGWGRKLTRWFSNTFLENLGLKKVDNSFHSLRHSAITMMRRGGVDNPTVRALVGHEQDGVTEEVYTHGYELAQLQPALEKVAY